METNGSQVMPILAYQIVLRFKTGIRFPGALSCDSYINKSSQSYFSFIALLLFLKLNVHRL